MEGRLPLVLLRRLRECGTAAYSASAHLGPLRTQTPYRTVAGMLDCWKFVKLLCRAKNLKVIQLFSGNTDKLDYEPERATTHVKFKSIMSMQRYSKSNREEQENAEFLLPGYPDLQIPILHVSQSDNLIPTIVLAREYIFSKDIGIWGDLAAGAE